MMRLLNRTREAGERVESARFQVDMALLKLAAVLERTEEQIQEAKEELSERRSSG